MWVNTDVFIAAGRALREDYPREGSKDQAPRGVALQAVFR
jgi:hypothetical protein